MIHFTKVLILGFLVFSVSESVLYAEDAPIVEETLKALQKNPQLIQKNLTGPQLTCTDPPPAQKPNKKPNKKPPLFKGREPLQAVIKAEFSVSGKRVSYSENPAELSITVPVKDAAPKVEKFNVKLVERGNWRRGYCHIPPIKMFFDKKLTGTLFEDMDEEVKFVPHCRFIERVFENTLTEAELGEKVLAEYAAYRMLEGFGLPTYRTRLIEMSYQTKDGKEVPELKKNYGFFIEPHKDLAERLGYSKVTVEERWTAIQEGNRSADAAVLKDLVSIILGDGDKAIRTDKVKNLSGMKDKSGKVTEIIPYDYDSSYWVMSSLPKGKRYVDDIQRAAGRPDHFWYSLDTYFKELKANPSTPYKDRAEKLLRLMVKNQSKAVSEVNAIPLQEGSKVTYRARIDEFVKGANAYLATLPPPAP